MSISCQRRSGCRSAYRRSAQSRHSALRLARAAGLRCGGVPGVKREGAPIRLVWDWENVASCLVSIFGHDLFSIYFDADQGSALFLKRRQWMSFCLQVTAGAAED